MFKVILLLLFLFSQGVIGSLANGITDVFGVFFG